MGPRQIMNFALVCQRFHQLASEFNRKKQGQSILHQWRNTNQLLQQHYKLYPVANEFKILDFSHEFRDIGLSIVNLMDDRYDSIFFLCSLLTGEFFDINNKFIFHDFTVYKRHLIKAKNWLIYHGHFDYEEKDLLIDLSDLSKVTMKFFKLFNLFDQHPSHPITKFEHCLWCSKISPDSTIDDIPHNRDTFEILPSGDKLYLTISRANCSIVNMEASKTNWFLSNSSLTNVHQYFADRYILEKTRSNELKVVDMFTNVATPVYVDSIVKSEFINFSKFIRIGQKFYLTCGNFKDWFILWKSFDQWFLTLFKTLKEFSLPVYCSIEQRVLI